MVDRVRREHEIVERDRPGLRDLGTSDGMQWTARVTLSSAQVRWRCELLVRGFYGFVPVGRFTRYFWRRERAQRWLDEITPPKADS